MKRSYIQKDPWRNEKKNLLNLSWTKVGSLVEFLNFLKKYAGKFNNIFHMHKKFIFFTTFSNIYFAKYFGWSDLQCQIIINIHSIISLRFVFDIKNCWDTLQQNTFFRDGELNTGRYDANNYLITEVRKSKVADKYVWIVCSFLREEIHFDVLAMILNITIVWILRSFSGFLRTWKQNFLKCYHISWTAINCYLGIIRNFDFYIFLRI